MKLTDRKTPIRLSEAEATALQEYSKNVFSASEVASEIIQRFGPYRPRRRERTVGVCKKVHADGSVDVSIPNPDETEAFSQRLENVPSLLRRIAKHTP